LLDEGRSVFSGYVLDVREGGLEVSHGFSSSTVMAAREAALPVSIGERPAARAVC
jgi:hypothetical protein